MRTKRNDLPEETIYQFSLTLKQVRIINHAVACFLYDVEQGVSDMPAEPLKGLLDLFYPVLNIPMTADEINEANRQWHESIAKEHQQIAERIAKREKEASHEKI